MSDLAEVRRQPSETEVDAVATDRDALCTQERELPPASRDAPIGADDAMPGEVIVDGRENPPDQAWRAGVDVAIGADKPRWDRAYPRDDAIGAIGARLEAGSVALSPAAKGRSATTAHLSRLDGVRVVRGHCVAELYSAR